MIQFSPCSWQTVGQLSAHSRLQCWDGLVYYRHTSEPSCLPSWWYPAILPCTEGIEVVQARKLWNTVDQLHDSGQLSSECHLLRPVQEEGSYPIKCWSCDAKCAFQPCQQDIRIDTVERGTEIKQTEQRYLLLVHRAEKVPRWPEATQSRLNDAFDTLTVRLASSCFPVWIRQSVPIPTARLLWETKVEVGDWPVVLHVRRIEIWFLYQRRDDGMTLRYW